jgi:hypothetical protein
MIYVAQVDSSRLAFGPAAPKSSTLSSRRWATLNVPEQRPRATYAINARCKQARARPALPPAHQPRSRAQPRSAALKDLGPLGDKVAPAFIPVDSTRDTPSRLASYSANCDTRIVGSTESNEPSEACITVEERLARRARGELEFILGGANRMPSPSRSYAPTCVNATDV